MRVRTAAALAGTAGGLALLLSFKTPTTTGAPRSGSSGGTAAPPAPTPTAAPAPTGGVAPPTTSSASSTLSTGNARLTGAVVSTPFGDVQVEVDTTAGRITDVRALQLPNDRRRSAEISSYVAPILHDEAVQVQSAQIDIISGATYTSEAYAESLQAALDGHG